MVAFTFKIMPDLLAQLKEKSGDIPASVVIRRLIIRYLRGEIGLD